MLAEKVQDGHSSVEQILEFMADTLDGMDLFSIAPSDRERVARDPILQSMEKRGVYCVMSFSSICMYVCMYVRTYVRIHVSQNTILTNLLSLRRE